MQKTKTGFIIKGSFDLYPALCWKACSAQNPQGLRMQ